MSLLAASSAFAQLAGRQPAPPPYEITARIAASGESDMEAGGVSFDDGISTTEWAVKGEWTTFVANGQLTVGLGYETIDFGLDSDADLPAPEELTESGLGLMYRRGIVGNWSALGMASVGWRTAGSSFDSDGFSTVLAAGVGYVFSPQLIVRAGVGYDSLAVDEHRFIPFFGLHWEPAERWSVDLGMPNTAISYTVSDVLTVSLKAEGHFGSYYVAADEMTDAGATLGLGDSVMEYRDIRAGLGAEYRLSETVTLTASAGAAFSRRLDYRERGVELKSDGMAPYGSIGIKARF